MDCKQIYISDGREGCSFWISRTSMLQTLTGRWIPRERGHGIVGLWRYRAVELRFCMDIEIATREGCPISQLK